MKSTSACPGGLDSSIGIYYPVPRFSSLGAGALTLQDAGKCSLLEACPMPCFPRYNTHVIGQLKRQAVHQGETLKGCCCYLSNSRQLASMACGISDSLTGAARMTRTLYMQHNTRNHLGALSGGFAIIRWSRQDWQPHGRGSQRTHTNDVGDSLQAACLRLTALVQT